MSDVPEKKEKAGGMVDTIKRTFSKKEDDAPEKEEAKEDEKKVVKADVPPKPLEAPKAPKMEEAPSKTEAKMVETGAVKLDASMHRKFGTVLKQKSSGARKYFRSK